MISPFATVGFADDGDGTQAHGRTGMVGLRGNPMKGYSTPVAIGMPQGFVEKSEYKVLSDVAHGGTTLEAASGSGVAA